MRPLTKAGNDIVMDAVAQVKEKKMSKQTKNDLCWIGAYLCVALMWLAPALLIVLGWA